jgi:chromate reductase
VVRFHESLAAADALLIATPEYNHGIPGVLKNAIDWASRPPGKGPITGKPVAILGASTGAAGTARSQMELRLVCGFCGMHVLGPPEVLIARAQDKFDENGRLTDEATGRFLGRLLASLGEWTRRLGPA